MKNKIKLVVLGASAFPELNELIKDINRQNNKYEVIEVLDDNESLIGSKIEGVKVGGPLDKVNQFSHEIKFVFGIGSHKTRIIRNNILERLGLSEDRFETLIHPNAKIYSTATIGTGVIIHTGSVVYNDSIIGPFSIIVANSIIGARNIIGKGSLITSLVSLTTDVKVGSFSFIGTHSSIAEGVEIGPGSMIGMRSFVCRDVSPGSVVFGDPMKIINKEKVPEKIINNWNKFKKG